MEFTKEIAQILELSIFSSIKKESYWPLLERGRIVKIIAGQMIPQSSDGTRYAGLILSGFFRLYLYAPSGRQTTVRYAKPGEMMGIVGAIVTDEKSGEPEETHVQALADSEVLAVSFEDVRFFGKKLRT